MKILLLEDEPQQVKIMQDYLSRYEKEHDGFHFVLESYARGLDLLENYHRDADLVFLDIQVPDMLGIDVARRIRDADNSVMLIFVTNLRQYAIDGYSVNAFDYILKPINFFSFAKKLDRALRTLSIRSSGQTLDLKTKEGGRRIPVDEITYVSVYAHDVYINTLTESIQQWGTLAKYEELLKDAHFCRCSASCIVNLKYVQGLRKEQILISGGDTVTLSRSRRKEFLQTLAQYKGGTI